MATTSCSLVSDRSFGPRVNANCRSFDFTLFFEDAFMGCLPTAVFIFLLPSQIIILLRRQPASSVRSKLLISKQAILVGLLATQLAFLALRTQNPTYQTTASIAADVLSSVGTMGALLLSYLDHRRSSRPSTLLSLYLSTLVALDLARVRTLWLMGTSAREPVVMTVTFSLTLVALLLESTESRSSLQSEKRSGSPEQYSGFWKRTCFTWLAATFRAGYIKVITVNDLPPLDTQLESHLLHGQLVDTWAKYDQRARHSLLRACFRTFLPSFISAVLPRLCLTVFTFTLPFLIDTTVSLIGLANPDWDYGRGLIGAWALVFLGVAASTAIQQYQNFRFVTRVKGALIGLVYHRAINIRSVDAGEITAVALMGTDVERIGQNLLQIQEAWASPLDIGIAIWLLERQLSLACIAPIVIILVFMGMTAQMMAAINSSQKAWIEKVQERLRVTSSMLNDMKAVKMLGLGRVISAMIQGSRRAEIETSKVYRKFLVWILLLSNSPANLAPVSTFALYVIIAIYWKNESLLTAQAFTSVALISLLTTPVLRYIQEMPSLIQCIGSFDRIQDFANYNADARDKGNSDETTQHNGSAISHQPLTKQASQPGRHTDKHFISFEDQSYGWTKEEPPVLKEIKVKIQPGSVTMVVGPVGSGKSTFLESILGETVPNTPSPHRELPSVAYCSQQPWLKNGTIRSNIVGVSPYERTWYDRVVSACGLGPDMKMLGKGDQTLVGSNGVALSGGQKQRIALARAVYSRRSTVLLDDVFSGMDAHTIDRVATQLFGRDGLFRSRSMTVILATHSSTLMALADTIIALDNGKIVETGSPEALLDSSGYFSTLGLKMSPEKTAYTPEVKELQGHQRAESRISVEVAAETDKTLEDIRRKNGDFSVYKYYFASSGYLSVVIYLVFVALWIFCTEFPTIWLKWWSDANTVHPNQNVGMYMGVYAFLSVFGVFCISIGCWVVFITLISNSAYRLHSDLLESTLKAPFRFFAATDVGSLTNRFSQDMELIGMNLPVVMVNYSAAAFSIVAKVIIIAVFSQYLAVTIPFVGTVLFFLQKFYLQTSRQVRLLEIEAKAPLYTNFLESVTGASTIRAFGWGSQYQERNYHLIDYSQRPAYLQACIQYALAFCLDVIVAILAIILVGIIVTWKDKFSAGSVGVSLVTIMTFSKTLARLIQMWTEMESSIGAVARVKRFVAETESEEKENCDEAPENWPQYGAMEFQDVVAAHRPDAEPVVKHITISVKPSQHIAICGRSGSGKSSLVLCLLHMIDMQSGHITIDKVDISSLSCIDVRSRINVVPQDPFLMPGTIHFNIDPFGTATEEEIIGALKRVRLWGVVNEQGGLGKEMDSAAWSAGQRQLLCLARAMVRKGKVLILDEATSSVDGETESVMQEIIDTEFRDSTVLAVMHRLKHIVKYDKVALLDHGVLAEYDDTSKLLATESRFAGLYKSSTK